MNRQRFLPSALAVLTLARLLLLATRDLSPVEAHAALCMEHHELWYPLTGPLLPIMMKWSTTIFGMNEFGVRFFAPLLMLGAGLLVMQITRALFDATTAAWAAVLFQVTPAVNLAAISFTNTTLAIAGSAVMLYLLRIALHRPNRFHLHWWAVAGMCLLAFLADWRLAVMGLSSAASLMLTRRGRHAMLKWPVMPILGGTFALTATIFLAWNSEHSWVAFHFYADHAGNGIGSSLHHALLAFGLLLLPAFVWAFVETALNRQLTYAPSYLMSFAWPLLTLDLLAFTSMDWPQTGFAAWLPPVVMLTAQQMMQTERLVPRYKVIARTLLLVATAAQSCLVMQTSGVRLPLLHLQDPARDLNGWKTAANEVRAAIERSLPKDAKFFLVAERWQLAEALAFHLRDLGVVRPTAAHPIIHVLPDDVGHTPFASWPRFNSEKDGAPYAGATAVFITEDEARHDPPQLLHEHWPQQQMIATFRVDHANEPVRTIKVFACSPSSAADK